MRERGIVYLEWVDSEGGERKLIYLRHRNMWKHKKSVYINIYIKYDIKIFKKLNI